MLSAKTKDIKQINSLDMIVLLQRLSRIPHNASSYSKTESIQPVAKPNTTSDSHGSRLSVSSKEQLLEAPFAVVPYPRDKQNNSAILS